MPPSPLAEEGSDRSAPRLDVVATEGPPGYRLVDSGGGRKLESFGGVLVDRPEPQALWRPRRPELWARADAAFAAEDDEEKGRWRQFKPVADAWDVSLGDVTVRARLMAFRHLGLFPEQWPHWQWMLERVKAAGPARPRVLNLFGYTGAASLLAAHAGAEVTHVDASKKAIGWARENQSASKLGDAPIRWLLDDARKFAAREVRRGKTYDVVLVDPPKFGRGPDGEVWDLFAHLPELMKDCRALLAPGPSRLVLTAYAIRASALSLDGLVREIMAGQSGAQSAGELALREDGGARHIGTSLFVRWQGQA